MGLKGEGKIPSNLLTYYKMVVRGYTAFAYFLGHQLDIFCENLNVPRIFVGVILVFVISLHACFSRKREMSNLSKTVF